MSRQTRRDVLRIGGGVALALLGGATTVSADDDTSDQGDGTTAEVRVGHLSPNTPAVDVYVAPSAQDGPTVDDKNRVVNGLTYPNFAPTGDGSYLNLDAGSYDISVTPAEQDSPEAIDIDGFEFEANKNYTVLAVDLFASIDALPLVDNDGDETALPPADAGLVRLVHASPDAGTVDVVVEDGEENEVTTIAGVDFKDATGYLELEPGEYTALVQKGGSTVLEVSLSVDAGTKVTGYVIGEVTEDTLSATTTLDATSPAGGRGDEGRGN